VGRFGVIGHSASQRRVVVVILVARQKAIRDRDRNRHFTPPVSPTNERSSATVPEWLTHHTHEYISHRITRHGS